MATKLVLKSTVGHGDRSDDAMLMTFRFKNGTERSSLMLRNSFSWLCTFALALMLFPVISVSASAADLTIGVIGDQTGSKNIAESYRLLQSGVEAINAQKPDVVIHVGDLIESNNSPERIRTLFGQATGILGGLKAPWYMTPGDHDVNPVTWKQDSQDRGNEQLFQSMYAKINPLVKENLFYSFDFKSYHFVSLYAMEHLHTDPRWGNVYLSGISDKQYDWLKNDLANARQTKGVIVFVHQPLWYNWGDWERVHNLLRNYPVVAVVAGHFHYGQIEQHDFPYITVGATGSDIKDTSQATGGSHHVTVISVAGRTATHVVIPLAGTERVELPTRSRMDRIQAVDSGLDNAYIGNLYLHNGQLVGDCETLSPAEIKLPGVGNPTNFTGTLVLSVSPGEITVSDPDFDKSICNKASADGMKCELSGNAGIYYANTSIVGPDTSKQYTWKGTLKTLKPIDTSMPVSLNARFTYGAGGDLDYVGKQYRVPVVECKKVPVK